MAGRKPDLELRKGWTTGACATACAKAAFRALITHRFDTTVTITLPDGQTPEFTLKQRSVDADRAVASTIKDAGDDPDVTHQAEIVVEVRRGAAGSGVGFRAGAGVGTVTLPGLPLAVGEPAINPAPRRMISAAIDEVARAYGAPADVEITISIPGGQELALKTMNGRLGIQGGLSVLGTTGVVIPYSCASWINAIHRGVDVAKAAGIDHLAAATGSTSESAVARHYGLEDQALIDMGDFAGGLFKYLRKQPIARLTLAGGFGKLSKLAQGHLDLHSSRSQLDMGDLAGRVKIAGGNAELCAKINRANTGLEALDHCQKAGMPIADLMAAGAREVAMATLAGGTAVEVLVFDRQGQLIGQAHG